MIEIVTRGAATRFSCFSGRRAAQSVRCKHFTACAANLQNTIEEARPPMTTESKLEPRAALPAPARTVFFVSDGTGITAETFGHAVLTQFNLRFRQVRLPFIDTLDKAHDAVRKINEAFATDGQRPIIFSTLVKAELSDVIRNCK